MRSLKRKRIWMENLYKKSWRFIGQKKNAGIKYCIEVVEETAFNGKGKKKW